MTNLLIKNGKIIDGSGAPAFGGSLLIENGAIKEVVRGDAAPKADKVIDAGGKVVCPGFIDMHSHMDFILPCEDHADLTKAFVEQGVTTLVGGNCGFSPAPIRPETLGILDKSLSAMLCDKPLSYDWNSTAEFLDYLGEVKPLVNIAQLVGHASLRLAHSDSRRGAMSADDLKKCAEGTRRALDEGACGLSFGLGYDPGMYSPLNEIEAFCKAAKEAGKPATVHLKALSRISPTYPVTYLKAHNLRALNEMLDIARKTGVKLQISHFIYVGRNSFGTYERCLDAVDKARKDGVDVMIDAFPYTCGNTTINVSLPYWFLAMGAKGYHDFWARTRLRAELELGYRLVGFIYSDFQIMNAATPEWQDLNGMTIEEVGKKWNTSAFDAMLKISEKTRGEALMLYHTYSGLPDYEEPLEATLSHEACLFETDALVKSVGHPNPASLGTFPRILGKYVRERKLFNIENAVRRMTSASAERFGIADRGILKAGKAADVVIFDEKEISDTPPVGSKPAGRPKGIDKVFINGVLVVDKGNFLVCDRPGKVLKV